MNSLLGTLFTVFLALFGTLALPCPDTAAGIATTYDGAAYTYDAPVRLSLPDTAATDARESASMPRVAIGGSLVAVGRFVVAANTADEGLSITTKYARPGGATTNAQRAAVQGQPCVECGNIAGRQVADHIDPLVKEYYRTGTIDLERMRSLEAVQPQCPTCSARQGAFMSRFSIEMRNFWGLE